MSAFQVTKHTEVCEPVRRAVSKMQGNGTLELSDIYPEALDCTQRTIVCRHLRELRGSVMKDEHGRWFVFGNIMRRPRRAYTVKFIEEVQP